MADIKRILVAPFIILAEYHILWNLLYPYLWKLPYQQFEFAFAICLIIVTLLYSIRCAVKRTENIENTWKNLKSNLTAEHTILIIIFIWFSIDCILQQSIDGRNYIQINDWKLFCSALAAFVFFPFIKVVGEKNSKAIIEQMVHITVAIYTIFWVWVLWQYFHLNFVTFPSGNHLGMAKMGWLEAGVNRNVTAAHSAVVLALCIFMIVTYRNKTKALYLIAAIVHIIVVMLTDSRTSYIAVACTICTIISIELWERYLNKVGIIKKAVLSAIIAVLCLFILGWIKKGVFSLFLHLVRVKTGQIITLSTAIRPLNGLSGRKAIWLSTIKMLISSPKRFFIGVLPSQIGTTLLNMGLLKRIIPHCHNVLLEVGASLGVPAMLLYIWFLYSIFRRCIFMIGLKSQRYRCTWGISVVLLCIILIDIMESFLFGPTSVNMPVFHIFAGWIIALDEIQKRESGRKLV